MGTNIFARLRHGTSRRDDQPTSQSVFVPPESFQFLSRVNIAPPFEQAFFGSLLSPSQRNERRTALAAKTQQGHTPRDRLVAQIQLAVLAVAGDDKSTAWVWIESAIQTATTRGGEDMFAVFTCLWPLAAYLVRHSYRRDPPPALMLVSLVAMLKDHCERAKDESVKETAHLTYGAFKVNHRLEAARMGDLGEAKSDELVQSARREARAIAQGYQGVFGLGGWVEMRIEDTVASSAYS